MSIRPTTSPALADQLKDPAYSAYVLLRTLFTVAPILFGLDKFFNLLTHPQHWNMYLAGWINDLVPGTADQCMYLVGAIEIVAGVLVAVAPRIGAWVVAAWLAGIILNLVTRAWGRQLEAPPAGADTEETIDHLVAVLDDLGFAPERRASNGRQQVGLRHCPFLELAETQAGVVCPVHLGIMRGALQTWGAPVTVDRLDAFVEPDLCLAHFTPLEGAIR